MPLQAGCESRWRCVGALTSECCAHSSTNRAGCCSESSRGGAACAAKWYLCGMGCVPDPACCGGLVTSNTSVVTLALAQHHWTAELRFVVEAPCICRLVCVRCSKTACTGSAASASLSVLCNSHCTQVIQVYTRTEKVHGMALRNDLLVAANRSTWVVAIQLLPNTGQQPRFQPLASQSHRADSAVLPLVAPPGGRRSLYCRQGVSANQSESKVLANSVCTAKVCTLKKSQQPPHCSMRDRTNAA
jgi:hypothetical protein